METVTYIAHYGIKDMHWGERRFQNEDGSLTAAGKERYARQQTRSLNRKDTTLANHHYRATEAAKYRNDLSKRKQKLADKGVSDDSRRMKKLDVKIDKANSDFTEKDRQYVKTLDDISSDIHNLQSQGYTVTSKPTIRSVKLTGAEAAANVGAIIVSTALLAGTRLPFVVVPQYRPWDQGTQYKVRTNSNASN